MNNDPTAVPGGVSSDFRTGQWRRIRHFWIQDQRVSWSFVLGLGHRADHSPLGFFNL